MINLRKRVWDLVCGSPWIAVFALPGLICRLVLPRFDKIHSVCGKRLAPITIGRCFGAYPGSELWSRSLDQHSAIFRDMRFVECFLVYIWDETDETINSAKFFFNYKELLYKIIRTKLAIHRPTLYSIYRTDKIMLLLIMATLQFLRYRYRKLCIQLIAFISAQTPQFWILFACSKIKISSISLHVLSQTLSKTQDSFMIGPVANCPICSATFNQFANCFWLWMKKSFMHRYSDMLYPRDSNLGS